MDARQAEQAFIDRCVLAARGAATARDRREAHVFRLGAMVIQSRRRQASDRLMQAAQAWFEANPGQLLPAVEVVRQGWVISLPRLRDTLDRALARESAHAP